MTERIPVAGPWITEREIAYVADAAATNWYGRAHEYVARFEEAFTVHSRRRRALSLPSCTSGLHLALLALGVGPGDEVVVPESTWIATAAPVSYVGAEPVFADVDPSTWCITPETFEAAVSQRTRAVIAVDLYGGMPAFADIETMADHHGVAVIEDAAEAVGSVLDGRPAGSFGQVSAFSFHGSKTLTTGEGGMVVVDDDALAERMSVLRDHGRAPGDHSFFNAEIGYKYKMSSMQAALGLAQLERLDLLIERKREIFSWYREELDSVGGLTLNAEPHGTRNSYWMVTAVLDDDLGSTGPAVAGALDTLGVDTRPFFPPLSSLPAFSSSPGSMGGQERNPVSYRLATKGLNLPSALSLSRSDVARVAEGLRTAIGC